MPDELRSLNPSLNYFRQNAEDLANALRGKKIKELDLGSCQLTSQNAAQIIEKADVKTLTLTGNGFSDIEPIIQALKQTSCKIGDCLLGDYDWDRMAQKAIKERISNQQKTILDNIDIDAILEPVSDISL